LHHGLAVEEVLMQIGIPTEVDTAMLQTFINKPIAFGPTFTINKPRQLSLLGLIFLFRFEPKN
jgi:hypothetical protein